MDIFYGWVEVVGGIVWVAGGGWTFYNGCVVVDGGIFWMGGYFL